MTPKRIIYSLIALSIAYVFVIPIYLFFANNYLPTDLFLLLGATTGLILFVMLFWQYVLSLKILTKFLKLDLSSVISLHKDLGIYSVMLLIAHPLFLGVDSLLGSGYLHIIPDFSSSFDLRVFLGELSLLLFLFTWYLSYVIKKNLTFRFWKKMHLFAYLILPITYLHSENIGSFVSNPLLSIFVKLLTLIFVILVIARLLDASGIFKTKYRVKSKRMLNDVLELTLIPITKGLNTKLGQFIYIQVGSFGESHPFSVVSNDFKSGELKIGVKVKGQFSVFLQNLELNSTVLLDGPHGQFLKNIEEKFHVVLIAGGIGVTPFVEIVNKSNEIKNIKRIDVFYATRTLNDAAFINRQSVAKRTKVRLVNVLNEEKIINKPNIESGMVNLEILNKYLNGFMNDCDYYICGPVPMMNAVSKILLDNKIDESKIHTEEFGW